MRLYQPLVLQRLEIRVPGIHVRQLAVHEHLPETSGVRAHSHRYAQFLVYLSGQGRQWVGGEWRVVRPGTLVFLPPGTAHSFQREANRRPVCAVLDFDWRGAGRHRAAVLTLPLDVLREVRQSITAVRRAQSVESPARSLGISASVLRLLDTLTSAMAASGTRPVKTSPLLRRVEALFNQPGAAGAGLRKAAERAGYQHDYLNRVLKRETGLTLGQVRSAHLLRRAQALLRQARSVAEVSDAMEFGDPNYFARWFRKQTGVTPSSWTRRLKPMHEWTNARASTLASGARSG